MKKMIRRSKGLVPAVCMFFMATCVIVCITPGCQHSDSGSSGGGGGITSSRAYKGHASDADMNNFVREYNFVRGTRLDDCQTCHRGGTALETASAGFRTAADERIFNPCDYCHLIFHHEGYEGYPTGFGQTLNDYGLDYRNSGRDRDALESIEDVDSDGDGQNNIEEIGYLRYPGDAGSYLGLEPCPIKVVTMQQIKSMPSHTQFQLSNTNKQQFDFYATYTGVKIIDLLENSGIDLTGAAGVDVLAPDGYAKSFSMDEITNQFPYHQFISGFGVEDLGNDCAFVEYPAETYGYGYGEFIEDDQWHLLAYEREGIPLEPAYLDHTSGRINGEGPFRNVIPPGSGDPVMNQPDRGKNADTSGCTMPEWNYNGGKDHNAGAMVKSSVILRIQPMPEGCEEFDIQNGGWALVDDEVIYIYGHNVNK